MTETRKLRVFLCHSSQDKPIVCELYQRLNGEGWIDPWLDKEKLLPGMDWDMEIENAVNVADVVIVCLSNDSVNKEGYVQKELRKVLDVANEKPERAIFIIPLRLEDCSVPIRLKNWQYEDYFPSERKYEAYKRVLESLKMRAKSENFDMEKIVPLAGLDIDGNDLLLKDAIIIATDSEKVTVSILQRKLRIGYTKSTQLIAKMEEMKIIKKVPNINQPTWELVTKQHISQLYAHKY